VDLYKKEFIKHESDFQNLKTNKMKKLEQVILEFTLDDFSYHDNIIINL